MQIESNSPTSLDTISIKLIESNPPSSSLIKLSQDRISLNYTASLQKISTQTLSPPLIEKIEYLSASIQRNTINSPNANKYQQIYLMEKDQNNRPKKNVFKKNSILKISNLNIFTPLDITKVDQQKQLFKPRKSFTRVNNSIVFCKTKKQKNSMVRTKTNTKANENLNFQPFEFLQSSQTRASRFYPLKNDKTVDQIGTRKNIFSIKRQVCGKIQYFQTDRKFNRFPIIKGGNFHSSAPASLNKKRKVLSCHENVEFIQRNLSNLDDKIIQGKSFKMSENDGKAKKYLQKVIQNRSSIIHFSQNKSHRFLKDFKENSEQWR